MPSPRTVNTSLPVILDKPSRNEVGKYSHARHAYFREKKTPRMFDSDMPELRSIFNTDVSAIKAAVLPEALRHEDDSSLTANRPTTCMPNITNDSGRTASNKLSNYSTHIDTTLHKTANGQHVPESAAIQDTLTTPRRERTQATSPVRTRRAGRIHSRSDLEKLAYGMTSINTNDDYITLDSRWEQNREISPRRSRTYNRSDLEKPSHGTTSQQTNDYDPMLDSPRREQSRDFSPVRARRNRTQSKSDLEKVTYGPTLQQTVENELLITRRSASYTEHNIADKKRRSGSFKTKGYPRLTREALSSNFITPVSRYSRIFSWLADCNEKSATATVPGHLPDIGLPSKQ